MARGRSNSQKKKKNTRENEEIDDENGDEGIKRCPHISRSVKLQSLQNKVPHTTLGQCVDCGELDSSDGLGICICLCCAKQGCDRNSEEKHALSHNSSNPSHSIVVHLQNWVVWCYACDDEVPVESESTIHNCIKLMLKAMDLSPPGELKLVNLSSSNKTSDGFKTKKDCLKNSQIRSRIKGLANLGNTCFFNAVMQSLCQTELLHVAASCAAKEGFSQLLSPKSMDVRRLTVTVQAIPGPVTKALWKFLQDFRGSDGGSLCPKQLFGEICKKATRFKGFRQQDSQELLRYLLDSIRSEEIKRVKLAILKSFGVSSEEDANGLDDNKRSQVKEYGACAEAPLIDSVFAGRLVSIVTCRQCRKEFKVEETFLDLSLPLIAPQQESWNFKPSNEGKQNRKSPKPPKNKDEAINIKNDDTEKEREGKTKNQSKHQQKSARKAERKKAKKGRGHGSKSKGKESRESVDNKRASKDNDVDEEQDEENRKESEGEDDELDQMNVSDLDCSGGEQERKLNEGVGCDENKATGSLLGDDYQACEEEPDNDVLAQDEKSSSRYSRGNDGGCDADKLNTNNREAGPEFPNDDNGRSSMDTLNSEMKPIVSWQLDSENFNPNAELSGCDPVACHSVNQPSTTSTSDFRVQEEEPHFNSELGVKDAVGVSVFLNSHEIVEGTENLTLNAVKEICADSTNKDSATEGSACSSSVDCALNASEGATLLWDCMENSSTEMAHQYEEREDETVTCKENREEPGGNCESLAACKNGTESSVLSTPSSSSNGGVDGTESRANEHVTDLLKNDQDLKKEPETEENQTADPDPLGNKTEKTENAENCEGSSEQNESDSEEEYERDSGDQRTLTRQPAYQPSPGECSVMSCLSHFCATELLDGSDKFACEECSRRARRRKNDKGSRTAPKEGHSDDTDDDSDDDQCKGAKAAKKKKTKPQTVYTVATKQLLISLAPPVLTLHLKRFQQARFTLRKLTKHVEFPLELNLAPFCSRSVSIRGDSEGRVLYSLYGIVQHSGNMNSGHYTAYVKVSEMPVKGLYDRIADMNELTDFIRNMWTGKTETKPRNSRLHHEPAPDGQWFYVSDTSVSPVPQTKVLKSQAYMLFYGRLPLYNR